MQFIITIDTENEAFDALGIATETIRILREQVIPAISDGSFGEKLMDANGNGCGSLVVLD